MKPLSKEFEQFADFFPGKVCIPFNFDILGLHDTAVRWRDLGILAHWKSQLVARQGGTATGTIEAFTYDNN